MYEYAHAQNVGYACAALSLLILASRLVISRCRREAIDLSFWLVLLSITTVTGRIITNYYYLQFGTASIAIGDSQFYDSVTLSRIKTGSILVLVARVLITATLWLQVSILLVFYSRITSGVSLVGWMIKATWMTAIATFTAIVLATFLECHPIERYWQVKPDPGKCVHALAQLLVQGVSNIVLDLMLLVIAYPLVLLRKRSWSERLSLYTLFALGTFCIVITLLRIILVFNEGYSQTTRSLWASIQMLVSTFVANAPTIYGSLRVARRQRSGQRSTPPHAGSSTTRRPSRRPIESWIKIDEEFAMTPTARREVLSPLPPASTFYDEETAPAPYSHPSTSAQNHTGHDT
ncbi:hypothetical protein F4778DRAFT_244684 [Xylariomycetidae sp. FL2044]|nr:hypothetical protein F4778DRAFT_244684 [Xylariomycetidae sp. FL2044]